MKYLILLFLLANTQCTTTAPIRNPIEAVVVVPKTNEPFAVLYTNNFTAVKINGAFFLKAKAFNVTYKGEVYGLFLMEDIIYLPKQVVGEKAKLDIILKDSTGNAIKEVSWDLIRK